MQKRIAKRAARQRSIDDLPAHMKNNVDAGKENIGPADVLWMGKEGDPGDDFLGGDLGPMTSLELILMAIIGAHPVNTKRSNTDRLEDAMKALIGRGKDGPKVFADDDDLLMKMARHHHIDYFGFSGKERSISELAGAVVDALPADLERKRRSIRDSQIRRLVRKFQKDIDRLMSRVTAGTLPEVMGRWGTRYEIYDRLKALGIPVILSVDPRPDATTPEINSSS